MEQFQAGPGLTSPNVPLRAPVATGARPIRPVVGTLTDASFSMADARILVVDDQEANVRLLERMLESAGVTDVHTLTDPREAVHRCLVLEPDLLLLDLHMPHIDGVAVLSALRSALPDGAFLPVIVLTADSSSDAKERALAAGAKDFLAKPLDRTEVLLRVGNLLETRALYGRVQHINTRLQSELDQQSAEQRRLAAEYQGRRARIERILDSDVLRPVFQPIADLGTGRIVGVEALARFHVEPSQPPNEWFAEAADVGLGVELELAAINRALEQLPALRADQFLSLNASPDVASSDALAARLASAPAERIVLELTEHTRFDDYTTLMPALDALRARGVRIAVDDAGAGYSGLQHILHLRPDILKLDLELTHGIDTDPARHALATALVGFSDTVGAVLLAEGIETPEELAVLRTLGVAWGQGYHLARPGPLPLQMDHLRASAA
jgi:EAL domain-containing protein (putative c-di-GMP-specific phosphodiesterase class I)/FixJ family two-component response regulator